MSKPLQIASNFVVMNADFDADSMPVTDSFYAKLEKKYGDFLAQFQGRLANLGVTSERR